MNRSDAIIALLRDARASGASKTSVMRVIKALQLLGCSRTEALRVGSWLDLWRDDGSGYNGTPDIDAVRWDT